MTIGIGAFGPHAGKAVLRAWEEAERRAAGDLHGFAVFTALDSDGVPASLECQRGGLCTLQALLEARTDLAWMPKASVAAVITSGPDRPIPLSQFLAAGVGVLVTGHRLPNRPAAEAGPVNAAVQRRIEAGMVPQSAVDAVLDANPEVDAGLIAVTAEAIGVANSAHVRTRTDVGEALVVDPEGRFALALLHNSIEPRAGLASAVAQAGVAMLKSG